ncbi:hypothetical protein [Nitratireductor sp. XY-223]|uniref:hypothetical protein n=1 Tax=Nitratireductor sp. XY-223 TaxID=2561926 RepID=UPI0010AA9B08|nr:hypothetical protein [Nitratireductor sp. XY-223]
MNEAKTDIAEVLQTWRQGDYAMNVGGFLYAHNCDEESDTDDRYRPVEDIDTSNVVGLLVVSQTCDVVRTGGNVSVCALVNLPEADSKAIAKGLRPSILALEKQPEDSVFADLSKIMSVSKELLATWERREGFHTQAGQRRLALALERKFGRFAFPEEIVAALDPLKRRASSKHDKQSPPGELFRSLRQIRVRATPSWEAETVELTLFVITHSGDRKLVETDAIGKEFNELVKKMSMPDGYRWSEPAFEIRTATQFSAEDIFTSQALDFEYLSV